MEISNLNQVMSLDLRKLKSRSVGPKKYNKSDANAERHKEENREFQFD
jgi:hypothetical protein